MISCIDFNQNVTMKDVLFCLGYKIVCFVIENTLTLLAIIQKCCTRPGYSDKMLITEARK